MKPPTQEGDRTERLTSLLDRRRESSDENRNLSCIGAALFENVGLVSCTGDQALGWSRDCEWGTGRERQGFDRPPTQEARVRPTCLLIRRQVSSRVIKSMT